MCITSLSFVFNFLSVQFYLYLSSMYELPNVGYLLMWVTSSFGLPPHLGYLLIWVTSSFGLPPHLGYLLMWVTSSCGLPPHVGYLLMWVTSSCGLPPHVCYDALMQACLVLMCQLMHILQLLQLSDGLN